MKKYYVYFIILGILALMIIHIELILSRDYAPGIVLRKVNNPEGLPEKNASCFADVISEQINIENKPLINLNTLYDFIDPKIFYSQEDKGFYLLETEFKNYYGEFEIRIVCYSPNFSGVSYTIINETNSECEFVQGGKLLIC